MAITIRDVAKRAGVSVGTVSRYLNGYKLKEEYHNRVKKAIEELNYKENIIAKGLKNNRTMTIGIAIASLTDIFSTSIVTEIEKEVEKYNYSIILCNYEGESQKQEEKLRFLKDRSVDGLIFYPIGENLPILTEYLEDKIPVVLLNEDITDLNCDKVLVDNANASFRAVEKLIHMNHRRIAIINGSKDDYVSKERLKGYLEALELYNIPVEERYIKYGFYSNAGSYNCTKELMQSDNPPTAIFITNYYMTFGAVKAINDLKIKIPDELSLIGFDHFDMYDVIKPALTVIEQPVKTIGQIAAQTIMRRIKGDYSDYPQRYELKTKMIIRESVKKI